ncbi:MAG: diguanylate cyclase, partial [Myxococcales bacterium]|nr:diguanylate cyclase [Myxococcales bacterium]
MRTGRRTGSTAITILASAGASKGAPRRLGVGLSRLQGIWVHAAEPTLLGCSGSGVRARACGLGRAGSGVRARVFGLGRADSGVRARACGLEPPACARPAPRRPAPWLLAFARWARHGTIRPSRSAMRPEPARVVFTTAAAMLGVAAIGVVDYATGTEVRVFPLYYVPISIAAWWTGRKPALLVAVVSTVAWLGSNQLAGLHTPLWVDAVNSLMQLGSFSLIALLIAGLRAAHAKEQLRSRTDALTGLLNTRGFFEQVPRIVSLAHRHRQPLTVAYVDLDDFKLVNDSQGHGAGDRVLQRAAETMRTELRRGDVAARIGGDEFVLLLPHTDEPGARSVLQRLHERLQRSLRAECSVTGASMGAAVF